MCVPVMYVCWHCTAANLVRYSFATFSKMFSNVFLKNKPLSVYDALQKF